MARMLQTLGFHVTKTTYGTWLPGDQRGSWSEAWSPSRGFCEPHRFHPADDQRLDIAIGRMKHAAVTLDDEMIRAVIQGLTQCVDVSNGDLRMAAAAIQTTHMQLLI